MRITTNEPSHAHHNEEEDAVDNNHQSPPVTPLLYSLYRYTKRSYCIDTMSVNEILVINVNDNEDSEDCEEDRVEDEQEQEQEQETTMTISEGNNRRQTIFCLFIYTNQTLIDRLNYRSVEQVNYRLRVPVCWHFPRNNDFHLQSYGHHDNLPHEINIPGGYPHTRSVTTWRGTLDIPDHRHDGQ